MLHNNMSHGSHKYTYDEANKKKVTKRKKMRQEEEGKGSKEMEGETPGNSVLPPSPLPLHLLRQPPPPPPPLLALPFWG